MVVPCCANLCGCTHVLCHLPMAASSVARCGYERCPQLARVKPKAIQSHAQDKATRQFKSVLQKSSAERSEELRFLWTKSSSPRWGSRVERWKPPAWGRRVQPENRKQETLGNVVDGTQEVERNGIRSFAKVIVPQQSNGQTRMTCWCLFDFINYYSLWSGVSGFQEIRLFYSQTLREAAILSKTDSKLKFAASLMERLSKKVAPQRRKCAEGETLAYKVRCASAPARHTLLK